MPREKRSYPPIGDYAVLGDTRTFALVSRQGSVDWLCLPDIADASVFGALLDRSNGGYLEIFTDSAANLTRRYVDTSNVLETRVETADGIFTIVDFMSLNPQGTAGPLEPERELIRIVEAVEGKPAISLSYCPRPGYGKKPALRKRGALGWSIEQGGALILFRTDLHVDDDTTDHVEGCECLSAGERRYVSVSFCRRDIGIIPSLGAESERKREETEAWWREWSGQMRYSGRFRPAVDRSLAVLRLLSISQTGAVAAAATTSLPEWIGAGRNWDYRYCWMRDAYFVLTAFMETGFPQEAQAYFTWLMHATQRDTPKIRPVYDLYGRRNLNERTIGEFEGYRNSAPVRVGNGAAGQLQLDSYGSVILAACEFVKGGGHFGASEATRLTDFADTVCRQWQEPDNGIWEIRGGRMHHCYSKAMCWAALDGVLRLREDDMLRCDHQRIAATRDRIHAAIMEKGWNERRGAFTGAFGADHLDASVLLLPKLGLIAADHPKMIATFDRIEEELTDGPFVWRYAQGVDGMPGAEGSFLACGFWAAEYLALRGDVDLASRRMSALIESANDLLLFAEEYDPSSQSMLGNFPQGFSHAALVHAAMTLDRADRDIKASFHA